MQTLFRIVMLLSVAGLLAAGMYFAVQNETVRGALGVPTNTTQTFNPGQNGLNGSGNQTTPPAFDGAQGARGAHDGGGDTTLLRNLAIFGATIFGVMVLQQTASRFTPHKKIKMT